MDFEIDIHPIASVRKAHNAGKAHVANVRNYYAGMILTAIKLEQHVKPLI